MNGIAGFNSTLVRLRLEAEELNANDSVCFNSTLVRLRLACRAMRETSLPEFQFHIGSIKTEAE